MGFHTDECPCLSQVTDEFNHINNLSLICRAHQLVQEGYKFHFPKKVQMLKCMSRERQRVQTCTNGLLGVCM